MSIEAIFEISAAIIFSLGGGGAIILLLSNYLGKIWAHRLMFQEQSKHEKQLITLEQDANSVLARLSAELDTTKQKSLRGFNDRLITYRMVVDLLAEVLGEFDRYENTGRQLLDADKFDNFNRARMRIYGYLAMLSPQKVMDANDELLDYLFLIARNREPYVWVNVRKLALQLLNTMREDLGVDTTNICYNGKL